MSRIKIGWASRDVSTDKPIDLTGQIHMRINRGVMDPVTVNALVLDDGQDQVIFLSCDMVGVYSQLLDIVREKLASINPEIPAMKLLMHVTHTHCGPSHVKDIRMFDFTMEVASSDEYRDYLSTQCAEAIAEAWEKRAEGGYAYGYGYAVVSHSRRVCYFDDISKRPGTAVNSTHNINGTAAMYGNTNDDNFSHYEAGADHFINLLYTYDAEGTLTGAIINVPCPSQNSETRWMLTADYWNDIRSALRAKYGDIFILPQCAASGDLSPRILHYQGAQERRFALKYGELDRDLAERKDISERVVAAFDEVLSWASKDIYTETKISHVVETVELSKRLITDEEYEDALAGYDEAMAEQFVSDGTPEEIMMKNSELVYRRDRRKGIIDRYEEQKTEKKFPMELHVIGVGDIAFASNIFELYMDFQHRIQARSPFEQTFIVQLAGQPGADASGSYLCTERGFEGRGYSASLYCNLVSPQGGQELVDETVRLLKEIR